MYNIGSKVNSTMNGVVGARFAKEQELDKAGNHHQEKLQEARLAEITHREARLRLTDKQQARQQTQSRLDDARLRLTRTQQDLAAIAHEVDGAAERLQKSEDNLQDARAASQVKAQQLDDARVALESARSSTVTSYDALMEVQRKLAEAEQYHKEATDKHKAAVDNLGRMHEQRRHGEISANHAAITAVKADADASARAAAGDHSGKLHVPSAFCAATQAKESLAKLHEEQEQAQAALPEAKRKGEEAGRAKIAASSEARRAMAAYKLAEQTEVQAEEKLRAASSAATYANAACAAAELEATSAKQSYDVMQTKLDEARAAESTWLDHVEKHSSAAEKAAEDEKEAAKAHENSQANLDGSRSAVQAARHRENAARRCIIIP